MKKTVVVFGLLSGAVSSVLMIGSVPFHDQLGFGTGAYVLGYTTMVLSFLLVYFGVRSYRDNVAGGSLTFGRAFAVGILITLISCLCYVATWEVLYFNFLHGDFMAKYYAQSLEQARASGLSGAALDARIAELKHFQQMYENPLFNSAITFLEPLPVGLVMTLLSAAVLRRKRVSGTAAAIA